MPTNVWLRLEPNSFGINLESGLQAAIHDPLWMLARQWQLGEFRFEDAGSPVHAEVKMTCMPLTRYSTNPRSKMASMPLEVLIEREEVRQDNSQPRLAAEAGLHFLRLLGTHGGSEALRGKVTKKFSLQRIAQDSQKLPDPNSTNTSNFLRVMANRVPDGQLIYALSHSRAAEWQTWYETLNPTESAIIDKTLEDWKLWYKTLFSEPGEDQFAWQPNRLEYNITVAAPALKETTLIASDYAGGHLDWYSFDMQQGETLGTDTDVDEVKKIHVSVIPSPINYPGMPVSRYWEFEDAKVNFGAMATAGREQLAKLLLIDFALISGDDWFVIPVVVNVGMLCNTNLLLVRDTFGIRTEIASAYNIDRQREKADGDLPWDLFRISQNRHSLRNPTQLETHVDLFLPPTLGTSLNGPVLEEILFLRDEMANMAWAIERIVEGPLNQAVNLSEAFFLRKQESTTPSSRLVATPEGKILPLVYRLESEIPEHWLSLQPQKIKNESAETWFQPRGKVQGKILKDRKPVYEEEVPREGAFVTRAFQYARWINGETYLWMSRRKGVGRGEGSSGLKFDRLEPPESPSESNI